MLYSHITGWGTDSPTPDQLSELFARFGANDAGRIGKNGIQFLLNCGIPNKNFSVFQDNAFAAQIRDLINARAKETLAKPVFVSLTQAKKILGERKVVAAGRSVKALNKKGFKLSVPRD